MARTVIDAHELSKTHTEGPVPVEAVKDVHLHIEAGEFIALVGPSGSERPPAEHDRRTG